MQKYLNYRIATLFKINAVPIHQEQTRRQPGARPGYRAANPHIAELPKTKEHITMSTQINTYPVTIKTDSSKPLDATHRLASIAWKTPKDKKGDTNYKLPPTRAVSIPILTA